MLSMPDPGKSCRTLTDCVVLAESDLSEVRTIPDSIPMHANSDQANAHHLGLPQPFPPRGFWLERLASSDGADR